MIASAYPRVMLISHYESEYREIIHIRMYNVRHWLMAKPLTSSLMHLVITHVKYKRSLNHICCHYLILLDHLQAKFYFNKRKLWRISHRTTLS